MQGDFQDSAAYQRLRALIAEIDKNHKGEGNYLYYLATSPVFFGKIVDHLGASELACQDNRRWRRVVAQLSGGDAALREIAVRMKKVVRGGDNIARIGGDEFALLLPQTDAEQALALSRRVETVFAELIQPLQLTVGVSMDHGVATYPQDGEQADQLIHVADERLYRLKQANHGRSGNGGTRVQSESIPAEPRPSFDRPLTPPAPISIESGRAPERTESQAAPPPQQPEPAAAAPPASAPAPSSRSYAIQRKAERVSMAGTNAYATLGDQGTRRARVLDLGFGGVAIELDAQEDLPENILAVLHVPILPPVRVSLKPVWSQRTTHGSFRVGCAFVS